MRNTTPGHLRLPPMAIFAVVSLTPVVLLGVGAFAGGVLPWLALGYMTLFAALIDQFVPLVMPDAPEGAEFPTANLLSTALAIAHFGMLPLAIWAIAGDSGLGAMGRLAVFAGFGVFFGQVSHPNAHEMIHRGDRSLFRLGLWVYVTLLIGHHTSAHRHIHHRHVGTDADPSTARYGEGFPGFARRAWVGSFRAGLAAENALRKVSGNGGVHPYAIYVGGALACLSAAWVWLGWPGLLTYVALASFAQTQLLLSDYVQHYGLRRTLLPNGRAEPVAARHSWNAPQWFSSAMMLNAPRHSDHHAHPARPYPALRLPPADEAPRLPYALPVMGVIALFPPLWRRVMHPCLTQWRIPA